MADTVDTFRRISILIFKWLLFSVLGIVGIAAAVWGTAYAYNYLTYERHAAKVEISVGSALDRLLCEGHDEFRLHVSIVNKSSKTLERVTFSLQARRKGHSTNLATYESYTNDRIIEPGDGLSGCWRAQLKSEVKDDPRNLDWKVRSRSMTFADDN